jgi:hypothetical protein
MDAFLPCKFLSEQFASGFFWEVCLYSDRTRAARERPQRLPRGISRERARPLQSQERPKERQKLMEPGKYYLFACSWDWTYIGKFVEHADYAHIRIDHALYFIRSAARFGVLCHSGLKRESEFEVIGDGILIPFAETKIFPWHAKTNWDNPSKEK